MPTLRNALRAACSPMTKEGIGKILKTLEESLKVLRGISKASRDKFLLSRELQDMAKWNFYVVVQSCLDLGNHIIAKEQFDLPESYEDILTILENRKIVSERLVGSLRGMGGFRNLIAHGYFRIDLNRLYKYLKKLDDIKRFVKALEPHL